MPSKRKARRAQPAPYSLRDRVGLSLEPQKDLVTLAKAAFVGEESGTQSNAIVESKRDESIFSNAGAIAPIYDPLIMALIYENSSNLRQNVDAYITNIDSFGHHFVPVIDLTADNADAQIKDALRAERRYAKKYNTDPAKAVEIQDLPDEPTPADVAKRRAELEIEIPAERSDLEMFFGNCTPEMPFSGPEGLRGLTRQDIEVFGYGYWEVIRNALKEVAQFNKLEARSMRMMPMDKEATDATILRRVSMLETIKVTAKKKFRNYVQRFEGSANFVFFKEFGDPRVVSSKTGKTYDTVEKMKAGEGEGDDVNEATEVIAFKITSVRSTYGAPRWVGAMLAVLGTRQSEEVNFLYFENRSIPPMAIIVSGGRINAQVVKRLEDHLANNIRGKRNFHKIMVIEGESASTNAEGTPNNGRMKIELKPLTDAQQQDALFQAYDERNADKVGQMFRLPRLLRGDVRDFNRSTAEASVDFAEIQVFGPIRQQFDWLMNTMVLPELGIKYHSFKSNAPTVRDPEGLAQMISLLTTAGVLTPEEARALTRGVFNEELPRIKDPWVKQPLPITLAGRKIGGDSAGDLLSSGVMSAPGAGPTQDAFTPGQRNKSVSKDDASTGDLAAGGALQPAQGEDKKRRRTRELIASGLVKLQNLMRQEEREDWVESRKSAEKIVIPRDLFEACFIPYDKAN